MTTSNIIKYNILRKRLCDIKYNNIRLEQRLNVISALFYNRRYPGPIKVIKVIISKNYLNV